MPAFGIMCIAPPFLFPFLPPPSIHLLTRLLPVLLVFSEGLCPGRQ